MAISTIFSSDEPRGIGAVQNDEHDKGFLRVHKANKPGDHRIHEERAAFSTEKLTTLIERRELSSQQVQELGQASVHGQE
ncbi:hypothetical protein ON010_g8255 [Phytophthora cinnamomi]|nr:hypothetical protein ON010_g8255 [Phytophthora cinnamomi]